MTDGHLAAAQQSVAQLPGHLRLEHSVLMNELKLHDPSQIDAYAPLPV